MNSAVGLWESHVIVGLGEGEGERDSMGGDARGEGVAQEWHSEHYGAIKMRK